MPSQRTKIYDAERKCIKEKGAVYHILQCQFSFETHGIYRDLNTTGHTICRSRRRIIFLHMR
jgi:hypothetical protein